MINFDITEYNFSKKDTDQYELSILHGVDSFAYMIKDNSANVVALREYYWPEGKQSLPVWSGDDKLQSHYRRVKIAFSKGKFCMVPQRLFQETEKATYLGHLSPIKNSNNIFSDNVSQHQAELIYEVEAPALESIERHFPQAQKKNLHTVLLEAMRPHASSQTSYHLAVHIGQKQIMIYAFDRTNLMLANAYAYRSAQDCLYYILLVYEQLGLKTEISPLFLAGRILEDSDIYRLLMRYVRKVSFLPELAIKRGPQLQRQPAYFFYDLYALGIS
ncbi:MAG: DUF3822 family protein [Saprospiraceae bacterium]|nr:DUF3822 family protein [Lewinella sp.]